MVYLAQYDGTKVSGFRRGSTFYPLSYKAKLEALGTIEYKTVYELDAIELQKAKDEKVASIDKQTALDIEALVGDNNKQKAKLAEATTLARLESKGAATEEQVTRLDELDSLNIQVEQLKLDGNTREALVQAATTIEELEAI